MKRLLLIVVACIMLCSCSAVTNSRIVGVEMMRNSVMPSEVVSIKQNKYKPCNYTVQKAVWLSYIDLSPLLIGKNEDYFVAEYEKMCQKISKLGCNTVYIHVRPFGDAFYKSDLYSSSEYVTGNYGGKMQFDSLEDMVIISHKYKLSVHEWINPLRCETKEKISECADDNDIKRWYDEGSPCLKSIDGDEHMWLNPAYTEVRKLIADGCNEIVKKYKVDGIHFDDYFYPTTEKSFDEQCFSQQTDFSDLSKWRLNNISEMVKGVYSAVKAENSDVLVGCSPQGNMENNYNYMYADVKKWCSESGYIDYICPQIYFGYNNKTKPFIRTFNEWKSIVTSKNVSLVTGLAVYKIYSDDEYKSDVGIIGKQIDYAITNGSGAALYNYINIFPTDSQKTSRSENEISGISKALNK